VLQAVHLEQRLGVKPEALAHDIIGAARFVDACLEKVYTSAGSRGEPGIWSALCRLEKGVKIFLLHAVQLGRPPVLPALCSTLEAKRNTAARDNFRARSFRQCSLSLSAKSSHLRPVQAITVLLQRSRSREMRSWREMFQAGFTLFTMKGEFEVSLAVT
jgi:hypothetical protein